MPFIYEGKKTVQEILQKLRSLAENSHALAIHPPGLLISADNLQAMGCLLQTCKQKLDLVYIDPPYNTLEKFYHSSERTSHVSPEASSTLAYEDCMPFDSYLEFIRERIVAIYHLLSERGTLYLHIDSKIGHYVKIITDEIFGRENFINSIARIKSNPKNFKRKAFGNQKDEILVYSRTAKKNIFNNVKVALNQQEIQQTFDKCDALGKLYTTVPCHAPGETKSGPTGGYWRGLQPPPGRHWRCPPQELELLDRQGLIEWSSTGNPRIKKYAEEHEGKKIQDVWTDYKDPPYPIYPTEKNMAMLEMIVRQSSLPDSLIMDCFCGSGSFLAAGLRHGRQVIGIDQSLVAIEVAKKRPELAGLPLVSL